MAERPRIKLKLTLTDKVIEVVAFLALVLLWILTLSYYPDLPEIIPIHFNGAGTADGYGSKNFIFGEPIIATIFYAGSTILSKFPHILNYPTEITEDNTEKLYHNAIRLIRFLKLAMVVTFILIVYKTQETLEGNPKGLGKWFTPLIIGLFVIPVIIYLVKSTRTEK